MAKRFVLNRNLFTRWPEEDFSDDGTRFRVYKYKGILPISQTTFNGSTFTAIRLDYAGFTYKDYKEDVILLNAFNGIEIERADKAIFIANCEYILNKYFQNKGGN